MPHRHHPAVIVVAAVALPSLDGAQPAAAHAPPTAEELLATLGHALASGLPVTVVTTASQAAQVAASIARRDLVLVPDDGSMTPGHMIARAVNARAENAGWIVLPGSHSGLKPATLRSVADALRLHAVVYAEHRGHRGYPVGFAEGMYSDLVSGAPEDNPRRLIARYPSAAVEVDDAAVLGPVPPWRSVSLAGADTVTAATPAATAAVAAGRTAD